MVDQFSGAGQASSTPGAAISKSIKEIGAGGPLTDGEEPLQRHFDQGLGKPAQIGAVPPRIVMDLGGRRGAANPLGARSNQLSL